MAALPRLELQEVPLVVDMDGTLLRTDSLHEGLAQAFRRSPRQLLRLPAALLGGKLAVKQFVADIAPLDAAALPYHEAVVELLQAERHRRRLILATAADRRYAEAVAAHLGCFDDVIASDATTNLSGSRKADALVARYGKAGFDYAGNDTPDLPVFRAARHAVVVAPTAGLSRRLPQVGNVQQVFSAPSYSGIRALFRAMRPHQWVKNLLVFVPLLATIGADTVETSAWPSLLSFFAFSLVASCVYLLNDLVDLSADRRHPRKSRRPLAAGTLQIADAVIVVPVLMLAGFLLATLSGPLFSSVLFLYLVATCLYTFWLKRVPLLDTIVLAGLYTLRILGGAAAIEVVPSAWLLSFSMFFFLSLALAKRHSELVEPGAQTEEGGIPGREYRPEDLTTLISQGTASGYAAVLVLALYIDSDEVGRHYRHPEVIWLICPLVLYWINKLWLNSQRREIDDDPVVWALTNRVSRAVAVICVALLLVARWLP